MALHQRSRLILATGFVAVVCALVGTATSDARNDQRPCNQPGADAITPGSSLAREIALLKDLMAKGWKPTAAGWNLLAGVLPPTTPVVVDGEIIGTQGAAQLAQLPVTASVRRPQALRGVRRSLAQTHVFLNCGIGQRANVNYAVQGFYPYTATWVVWNFVNFQTGASKNVRSAGTNNCPPNSYCFEYFFIVPAAPWYVFAATEQTSNYAVPEPISQYCGG